MKKFRISRIVFLCLLGIFFYTSHVSASVTISSTTSSVSNSSANITWVTDVAADSLISYGLTSGYGQTVSDPGLTTDHLLTIPSLLENTTYHYKITSTDASSNQGVSGDLTFKTATTSTGAVISNITMATSTGYLIVKWNTDKLTDTYIEYGASTSYGNSVSTAESVTSHTAYLQSSYFVLNSTYHYRIRSVDLSGNTTYSQDNSFVFTNDLSIPRAYYVQMLSVASTSAVISWYTDKPTKTELDYGLFGGALGTLYSDPTVSLYHIAYLYGLQTSTKYGYDIVLANDGGGKRISTDASYYFTTVTDVTAPVLSSLVATRAVSTSTISWNTNELAIGRIDYGTDTSYGSYVASTSLSMNNSFTLTGLSSFTTYHYRVQSIDTSGNIATSSDGAFTTGLDTNSIPLNQRVLILVNDATPAETGTGGVGASVYIGQYYANKRGIPSGNILHLNLGQYFTQAQYKTQIEAPIKAFLEANGGRMKSQIIYIVPMYGFPVSTYDVYNQNVSIDSYLSTMYQSDSGLATNLYSYNNARVTGLREQKFNVWSDQNDLKGGIKYFAVTRLDGPSAVIVKRIIDDAVSAESTLTRGTGTSYFDIRDLGEPSPSDIGYGYIDKTVRKSAFFTAASGFPSVFNHQGQTGRMIPPDSYYFYENGSGGYSAYIPGSSGIYVQSIVGQDATSTFSIPTIRKGEIDIGLKTLYWPDGGSYTKVVLNSVDPTKRIEVVYPAMGYSGSYTNGRIYKYFGSGTDYILSAYKMIGSQTSEQSDAVLKIVFDSNSIVASYISTSTATGNLSTLLDTTATPFDISSISLDFHGWTGLIKGISVYDESGNRIYYDPMTSDTTANYTWQTMPIRGLNTLFAYGWYSGNSSYDAYRFLPGSVAAQMTSYTGCWNPRDTNPQHSKFVQKYWGCWVGRMLEQGVTATFGTINEPYTSGYTMGDVLYDHFFSGYNFGDSYTAAIPTGIARWTMVGIGDPLYAPQVFANGYLDTTPPTAPTNVTMTSFTPTSISLSWSPGTDNTQVTGYIIYRNGIMVGGSPTTSFTDTGLYANTTYSYQVVSVDPNMNQSPMSNTLSAKTTTFTTYLNPYPTAPTVATSTNTANISWLTSQKSVSTVSYGATSTPYTYSFNDPNDTTSHSVTLKNLLPNTLYHYTVNNYSSTNTNWPGGGTDYTFNTGDFPLITNISVSSSTNNYTISWTTDRSTDGRVDYGITNALGNNVSTTTTSTSHSLTIPSTANFFKVTSVDAGSRSATSLVNYIIPTANPINFILAGLQGRSSSDLQKTAFRMQFLDPTTSALINEVNVGSTANGTIVANVAGAPQIVNVKIIVPGYLPETIKNVDLSTTTPPLPALTAGDINNDNVVNSLDASSLNRGWNTNYQVGDYNHDGVVNDADLQYVINNWFKTGN